MATLSMVLKCFHSGNPIHPASSARRVSRTPVAQLHILWEEHTPEFRSRLLSCAGTSLPPGGWFPGLREQVVLSGPIISIRPSADRLTSPSTTVLTLTQASGTLLLSLALACTTSFARVARSTSERMQFISPAHHSAIRTQV